MVGQPRPLGLIETSTAIEKSPGSVDPVLETSSAGSESFALRIRKIIVPPKVIDPNRITVLKLSGNTVMRASTQVEGTSHREQNNHNPRGDPRINGDINYQKERMNSVVHTRIIVPPSAVDPDEITVIKLSGNSEPSTQVAKTGYNEQFNHPSAQQQQLHHQQQQLMSNFRVSGVLDERKAKVKSTVQSRIRTLVAVPTSDHPEIAIVNSMAEDDRSLQEILSLEDVSARTIPRQRGGFVPDSNQKLSPSGAPDPCDKEGVFSETDKAALETGGGDRLHDSSKVSTTSLNSKPVAKTVCCPNGMSNDAVEGRFRLSSQMDSPQYEGHSRFINPLVELQKSLSSSPDPEDVDFLLQFELLST